ncbi:Txe/YoeB family addiction module toxin [Pseudoglutamicibacter cumminsii]|uniref:Endoribonuclease YoeB n=1 Tax=Pseudoglutamicibacter cumminsii TaxID=156979 RepID=A0ABX5LC36_9MICC|nr:Txe/YoeB family addiction module toxin [Pseudoglutamicibacter cumminsii]PWI28437.1 Txe/YoeB family addiction module toxin [Pseudoglutamicibacter cumminsii]
MAWEGYKHWQATDCKALKCINTLIDVYLREPFSGIGKPEQLKYGAQGSWPRCITDEHRLVYLVGGGDLVILQARYHY